MFCVTGSSGQVVAKLPEPGIAGKREQNSEA